MSSRLIWSISVLARRIWFRATLFSIAAVATALLAIVVTPYIPADLPAKIGADSVDNILGIIASSMLTVTTFSLSTMVSAYSAATSNATPRATRLVMEDSTTQNVLATFVGSFLFSLVGIVALTTGAYGEQGRVVLFVVTIGVIVLIVVTLLRWIDHLFRLGRVTETTRRVEEATLNAVKAWRKSPNFGGRALEGDNLEPGTGDTPLFADEIGYVQHVDAAALAKISNEIECDLVIVSIPGKLASPARPLGWLRGAVGEDVLDRAAACFSVGDVRSFDQDPRFGASVLTEIASRALSPAVNDPGTAIDVISRAMRILFSWHEATGEEPDEIAYPRLHVATLSAADLFDDLFTPIARDGAGLVEVGLRLQKTLATLSKLGAEFHAIALHHSKEALDRAAGVMQVEADMERLQAAAAAITADDKHS
ncbi:DUF2254 domain-containing protein [Rhizobium leguminosarum]|uniref:DUF2254 domain-containing protein n=1 Tax=Rhizobium leguminosarum TaxID=384 RepID=UPI001031DFB6|nr:DUF2254 domain-containing protein [Rhizobium leguminosarum]TAX22739.1 DUF2254 domain-containing protein [Rhizobium leguminosarum]TAX46532.1 DUF2254 domain-containing protein [Rhizobium leguminosarum]